MTTSQWSDDNFEAFLSSGSSLESIREDDLMEGNFGYRQWRRLCDAYYLSTEGSITVMAARLREQRRQDIAAANEGREQRLHNNTTADESNAPSQHSTSNDRVDEEVDTTEHRLLAAMGSAPPDDDKDDDHHTTTATDDDDLAAIDTTIAHLERLHREARVMLDQLMTPNQPTTMTAA